MIAGNLNGLTITDSRPGMAVPPVPINFYSALSSPAYFRAVGFIAANLSSLPRSVTLDGVKLAKPHPLQRLLERRPNGYQNATMFWQTLFFHAAHYSNGYARIERDTLTLKPAAVHNMLAENVGLIRITDDDGDITTWYGDLTARKAYPGNDVIHLAGLSYDGMKGIDTLGMHSGTLQSASTQERFLLKYLQTGTNVRAVIQFQGEVTKEKFEQVQTMLREQFRGLEASDDVLLLGQGADYKNQTASLQQSQLTEQQAMTTKKIAQMTGVDPYFMFDKSESKYAGAAEAGENVVRFTLRPWIDQIENELSIKLLTDAEMDAGHWIKIDTSSLTAGDIKTATDLAIAKKNAGLTTANQALGELGLPKSDDPEAGKLKTLGDTAPPQNAPAASA